MAAEETKLIIVKAEYGCEKQTDVTQKARAWAASHGGIFDVPYKTGFNEIFGDPEPGKNKLLHIVYKYGPNGPNKDDTWAESHPDIWIPAVLIRGGQVLTVEVVKAVNLRNVRLFGKMNPFVQLRVGTEKFDTKTIEHGHENPTFAQSFSFNPDGSDQYIHFEAIDKELVKNDHIGKLDVPLSRLILSNGKEFVVQLWHASLLSKKTAGDLVIKATFVDPNFVAAAPARPAVQPQKVPEVVVVEVVVIEQAIGNLKLSGVAAQTAKEFRNGRTLVLHSVAAGEALRVVDEKGAKVDGRGGAERKHSAHAHWKLHVHAVAGQEHVKLESVKWPGRWLRIDEHQHLNAEGSGGEYTELLLLCHDDGTISLGSKFWKGRGKMLHVGILADGQPKPPTETGTGPNGRFRPFFLS